MRRERPRLSWPSREERGLAGRFYLTLGLLYGTWVVAPFEFAYLFLVLERPEWAVVPLAVSGAVALVAELPTGMLADRWSRKGSVLLGAAISAVGVAAVPLAVQVPGLGQLLAVSAVFAGVGFGQTLMSGAQEAWVVDNLHAADRADLVEPFFARSHAVAAGGGAIAAGVAIALLVLVDTSRAVLDLLWVVTGLGLAGTALVAAAIPEHRVARVDPGSGGRGLRLLLSRRALAALALAVVVATFSGAAADQVFAVSLLTKGLDARAFGALTLVDSALGVVGPILGALLARRLGVSRVLAGVLVLAAAATSVVLVNHGLGTLLGLFVALSLLDAMWDPLAMTRLHELIPSEQRATLGSVVNQATGLATVLGLGALGLVLGASSEELQALSPDLFAAFTGELDVLPAVATGWLGVPVPDLALLGFVAVGLLAVPLVRMSGRAGGDREPGMLGEHPGARADGG